LWTLLEVPLMLIRDIELYKIQMKNPSEKIKLLETPKTYSTKHFLQKKCGQDKKLGYSKNE